MKKTSLICLLLASFLILSACGQKNTGHSDPSVQASSADSKPKADKIEVMNFHATQRCVSCTTLGKYSEEVVYEFFQPELKDGKIKFDAINVDLPENRALAAKYQARGSSLYINAIYDGQDHIEEDVKVWRLLGDEQQFKAYLKNRINGLLKK